MKTPKLSNILVPIDFSKLSIMAIETAKQLAQRFDATVRLAHVHEFFYPAGFSAPMSPIQPYVVYTYDEESEKLSGRQLIAIAKRVGLSAATTHILSGSPAFNEICHLAKNLPADLVVMSTHGRTGFKRVFLGSTAERIVQHSPCPVFIVRERKRQSQNGASLQFKKILVPIDFSRCSLFGLEYAIGFAERVGAKIILQHVVEYRYTTNGWITYELTEATRAAEKEAEQQMKKFIRGAKLGRVAFEMVVASGNTVDKICDYARECDVDLIVTSTHGRTGLKHVLMGSVAENVVRRAPCSVLAVPSFSRTRTMNIPQRRSTRSRNIKQRNRVKAPHLLIEREKLTRKYRKLTAHAFPERRKTNRFREAHLLK